MTAKAASAMPPESASKSLPAELNWDTLVTHVQEKSCVLVLGPSVLCGKNERGEEVPIRRMMALRIGQEIEKISRERSGNQPGPSLPDPGDLALMSSLYKQEKIGSDTEFSTLLTDFYRTFSQPSELLIQISKLPFRVILNTTPDNLMKRAYSKWGSSAEFKYYLIGEGKPLEIEAAEGVPVVYNLFGSLEDRNSLVLSQAHQMDFLDKIKGADTGLPPGLRRLLQTAQSVVFLGFDFENWYMKVFLHLLDLNDNAENIVAVHYTGTETTPPPAITRKFFDLQYRMKFVDLKPVDFISTLEKKVADASQKAAPVNAAVRRSLVFLYDKADEPWREKVHEQLRPLLTEYHFDVVELMEGDETEVKMQELISQASVVIPLISGAFDVDIRRDGTWLKQAISRQGDGCLVLPLRVRQIQAVGQVWSKLPNLRPAGGTAYIQNEPAFLQLAGQIRELFQDNYGS